MHSVDIQDTADNMTSYASVSSWFCVGAAKRSDHEPHIYLAHVLQWVDQKTLSIDTNKRKTILDCFVILLLKDNEKDGHFYVTYTTNIYHIRVRLANS